MNSSVEGDATAGGKVRPTREKAIRILTVSTVHRESGSMRIKHSWVPALRLNGKWLGKFGFTPGQKVRLQIGPGTILITATSPALINVEDGKSAVP
jgi:hypothetical protein